MQKPLTAREANADKSSVLFQRRYFSESELSQYSGLSKRTLQGWRLRNIGPPWVKLLGCVKYDVQKFDAWAASCAGENNCR
jgi:hypothetical protein